MSLNRFATNDMDHAKFGRLIKRGQHQVSAVTLAPVARFDVDGI